MIQSRLKEIKDLTWPGTSIMSLAEFIIIHSIATAASKVPIMETSPVARHKKFWPAIDRDSAFKLSPPAGPSMALTKLNCRGLMGAVISRLRLALVSAHIAIVPPKFSEACKAKG